MDSLLKSVRRIRIGLTVLGLCLTVLWLYWLIRPVRNDACVISWAALLCFFGSSYILEMEKSFIKNGEWPAYKSQKVSIRVTVFLGFILVSAYISKVGAYYFIAGIGFLYMLQQAQKICEKDNLSVYELAKKYFNAARERLGRLIQHGFKS